MMGRLSPFWACECQNSLGLSLLAVFTSLVCLSFAFFALFCRSAYKTWIIFLEESIRLKLRILGCLPYLQLPCLMLVFTSSFPRTLIADLKRLYIYSNDYNQYQPDDFQINQWLDLLRPFTDVSPFSACKHLCLMTFSNCASCPPPCAKRLNQAKEAKLKHNRLVKTANKIRPKLPGSHSD